MIENQTPDWWFYLISRGILLLVAAIVLLRAIAVGWETRERWRL